jgi:dTDP-4-dehydrorhamnose 3,5-epimerase
MNFNKTSINGLYVVEFKIFTDNRGKLIKPFSKSFTADLDIKTDFLETWFTVSNKNVIRAMHMQVGEFACEKLVSVVNGSVKDVILDTRKDSPSYGEVFDIELNSNDGLALYIPIGCAHGYKVLEDNTITMYMATEVHSAKDDVGYHWNSFGYDWNVDAPILSLRDEELPAFIRL